VKIPRARQPLASRRCIDELGVRPFRRHRRVRRDAASRPGRAHRPTARSRRSSTSSAPAWGDPSAPPTAALHDSAAAGTRGGDREDQRWLMRSPGSVVANGSLRSAGLSCFRNGAAARTGGWAARAAV